MLSNRVSSGNVYIAISHDGLQKGGSGQVPEGLVHPPQSWGRRNPAWSGRIWPSGTPADNQSVWQSLKVMILIGCVLT